MKFMPTVHNTIWALLPMHSMFYGHPCELGEDEIGQRTERKKLREEA